MPKYTWKHIREVFVTQLESTQHVLTFGTFGSKTLENDLDILITKKPGAKLSDFMREVHRIIGAVDAFLQENYDRRAIRFSLAGHEKDVLYIAGKQDGDLPLHVLVYRSFEEMNKHWMPDIPKDDSVREVIENDYECLLGLASDVLDKAFEQEGTQTGMYFLLTNNDRICSHYPQPALESIMEFLCREAHKRLGTPQRSLGMYPSSKELFYALLDDIEAAEKASHVPSRV